MKGFHRSRTKPQDLTEIVVKQDGFLSGLNKDAPKSDVGATQLTELKNAVTFRDRVEARGGLKPTTDWKTDAAHNECMFSLDTTNTFYDEDWDEIFYSDGEIKVTGTKDITVAEGFTNAYGFAVSFLKTNNKILICSEASREESTIAAIGGNAVIEDRGSDYFLRPLTSTGGMPSADTIATSLTPRIANITGDPSPTFQYAWTYSFVRIVDGIVEAESPYFNPKIIHATEVFDGATPQFIVTPNSSNKPITYYVNGSSDNFYTHARYYRTKLIEDVITVDTTTDLFDYRFYRVADCVLNGMETAPVLTSDSNLNVSDAVMTSNLAIYSPLWQAGYQKMPHGNIAEISSAMLIMKRSGSELNYSVISAGNDQKYMGWYHPNWQFSAGANGEVTAIKDAGSGCVVTTRDRTYYLDTVSLTVDEDQELLGIYTPYLPDMQSINRTIGIELNQRMAFVSSNAGKLIALTSDGAIRTFDGFNWGVDQTKDKVQSITKGFIKENKLVCSAVFANDAYYLTYIVQTGTIDSSPFNKMYTLRMGTTEESGLGFSIFTGEPTTEEPTGVAEGLAWLETATGWPFAMRAGSSNFVGWNFSLSIKDNLYVLRRGYKGVNTNSDWNVLLEYTGDKFDRKINKDVVDFFDNSTGVYESTSYYDIATEIEFPEMTGSSEGYFLYYLKSNFFLRSDRFSYKLDTEATKGYEINDRIGTGVGYLTSTTLSDVDFSLDARKGETDDIVATNEGFEPTSAVILQREVQDHRIRLTLRTNVAGFQLTGMEAHFKRHDRTELSSTTTTTNTKELNTGLYCLINQYLLNYAIGSGRSSMFDMGVPIEGAFILSSNVPQIVGTEASIVTGPDGTSTGISLPTSTSYEFQIPKVTATAVTIAFWYKDYAGRVVTSWDSDEINQYEFLNVGGVWVIRNNLVDTTFTTDASESTWNHVAFVYDGTEWLVYKNGVLSDSSGAIALDSYIYGSTVLLEGNSDVADVRMYNKKLTAEQILFYYNNVVESEGDYVNGY